MVLILILSEKVKSSTRLPPSLTYYILLSINTLTLLTGAYFKFLPSIAAAAFTKSNIQNLISKFKKKIPSLGEFLPQLVSVHLMYLSLYLILRVTKFLVNFCFLNYIRYVTSCAFWINSKLTNNKVLKKILNQYRTNGQN